MANPSFKLTGSNPIATVNGFVAVITTADFLNANADCLDGTKFTGGNLVIYSDTTKTTRYPIHVVKSVTGVSPDFLVYVRIPTYASAESIHVEADDVQTTQPVPSGTYGQYSTWSGRTLRMQCISDNAQEVASGLSVDDGGGSYISTPFGNGLYLNNTSVSTTPPYTSSSQMTYTFAAKIDSIGEYGNVFFQSGNFRLQKPWVAINTGNFYFNGNSADYSNCFSSWIKMGEWHSYTMTYNFSTDKVMRFYRDGVLVGTDTHWDKPKLNGLFYLLGWNNVVSSVAFAEFKTSIVPAAQLKAEYDNQSNLGTFWTASDYTDGGVINVTGSTPSYDYAAQSGVVDLTGSIDITGQTPLFSYSAIQASLSLTPAISILGQTTTYSYDSLSGDIDLTGSIVIDGGATDYVYDAQPAIVTLQGQLTILGETTTFSYNTISADVGDGAIWQDKPKAITNWGDKPLTTTNWTDKA